MNRLERPVAVRLARQVARQGLTLEYLDCPRWDGVVPSRMSCRGYLDGLRIGAFLRTAVGKDTVRLGNDALVMRFPTDLFSGGYNLLVQGVSVGGGTSDQSYLAFAGASSSSLAAPSFQATRIDKPMGALFV